jgi:D-alanyl-D-alanine dipeptidase
MLNENRAKIVYYTFLFVITYSHTGCSQYVNSSDSAAKPFVITNNTVYYNSIRHNPLKRMVNLNSYVTQLVTNFTYATSDNFTHRILYNHPQPFARLSVALAMTKVQEDLAKKGLGLKVFDAYRPYSVTKEMWKVVPDERYAANPAKGSGHNRGIAVDVTLVKLSSGEELPMPTGFDNFTEKAHHSYMNLPANILQNRSLLKTTMEKYGFKALSTEWWHYSLANAAGYYELLDLSFDELGKPENKQ